MPLRCKMYHWQGQCDQALATIISEITQSTYECRDEEHMRNVLVRCIESLCPEYQVPDPILFHSSGTWSAAVALPVGVAVMIGRYTQCA
jgi:hypothetical protein